MSILPQIQEEIKAALLGHQSDAATALRMLSSELKNSKIALMHDLSDQEELAVVQKEIKKRKEAAAIYRAQAEIARADHEEFEIGLFQKFLPESVSESELLQFLSESLSTIENPGPSSKGVLIRLALEKYGASTDGQTVSKLVNQLLQ